MCVYGAVGTHTVAGTWTMPWHAMACHGMPWQVPDPVFGLLAKHIRHLQVPDVQLPHFHRRRRRRRRWKCRNCTRRRFTAACANVPSFSPAHAAGTAACALLNYTTHAAARRRVLLFSVSSGRGHGPALRVRDVCQFCTLWAALAAQRCKIDTLERAIVVGSSARRLHAHTRAQARVCALRRLNASSLGSAAARPPKGGLLAASPSCGRVYLLPPPRSRVRHGYGYGTGTGAWVHGSRVHGCMGHGCWCTGAGARVLVQHAHASTMRRHRCIDDRVVDASMVAASSVHGHVAPAPRHRHPCTGTHDPCTRAPMTRAPRAPVTRAPVTRA